MRIALLHLAPRPGAIANNHSRARAAVEQAIDAGADWVVTPELCTSGYAFAAACGTDWIEPLPDRWLTELAAIAAAGGATLFIGTPERDQVSGLLHNSLAVVDRGRGHVGTHRKVNTLKVGSEAWSSPGSEATVVDLLDAGRVGLQICADACSLDLAAAQKAAGARAVVSAANWSPGEWGPAGEWEAVSALTNLPVFVCNRTGPDGGIDFTAGESVVAWRGARLVSHQSQTPLLVLIDWDFEHDRLIEWVVTELQ